MLPIWARHSVLQTALRLPASWLPSPTVAQLRVKHLLTLPHPEGKQPRLTPDRFGSEEHGPHRPRRKHQSLLLTAVPQHPLKSQPLICSLSMRVLWCQALDNPPTARHFCRTVFTSLIPGLSLSKATQLLCRLSAWARQEPLLVSRESKVGIRDEAKGWDGLKSKER